MYALADQTYREEFFEDFLVRLRQVFAVRAVYLLAPGRGEARPHRHFGGANTLMKTQVIAVTGAGRREGPPSWPPVRGSTSRSCACGSPRAAVGVLLSAPAGGRLGHHLIEAHGLPVLVDPRSAPIVAGSTIEFSDAMLGGGFKVNNPQAVHG